MAETFGANIATRAGEGDAYVYNWDGVQKTLNKLYERDYRQQQQVQDEYRKTSLKLQEAGQGVRPVDMEKAQSLYNTFKQASLGLQNTRNPQERATLTQVKDNAYLEYLTHVDQSKNLTKFKAGMYDNWAKDGGANASEDFKEKMELFDHMTTEEIRRQQYDNPMTFFNAKDDTPKDLSKTILGDQKAVPIKTPVLEGKMVKGWYVQENYKYVQPKSVIATNSLTQLGKSKTLTKGARQEFEQANPEEASALIGEVNQKIKEEGGQPLPNDYAGYFAARWIKMGEQETSGGEKKFEYNPDYKDAKDFNQQLQLEGVRHRNRISEKVFGHSLAIQRMNKAGNFEFDTEPLYNAAKKGDRKTVEQYLTAIASNNPKKPAALMISERDLLHPEMRRKLLDEMGVDMSAKDWKDIDWKNPKVATELLLNKINEKKGLNLKPSDISGGKIVPVFVRKMMQQKMDGMNRAQGFVEVKVPTIINPSLKTAREFHSDVSGQYVDKKKDQLENQQNVLDNLLED